MQSEIESNPEEFVRTIVTSLEDGRLSESKFVVGDLEKASSEEIQEGWEFLTAMGGEFKGIQSVEQPDSNSVSATLAFEETTAVIEIQYTDSDAGIRSIDLSQQATLSDQLTLGYGLLKGKISGLVDRVRTTDPDLMTPQDQIDRSKELFESCRAGEFDSVYQALPPEERSQIDVEYVEQSWNRYIDHVDTILETEHDEESGLTEITFTSGLGTFVWETELTETGDLSHWFIRQAGAQESDYSAPNYERQDQFTEHSFTISTGGEDAAGRITVPQGTTDPPVVVLLPGSGTHDVDATVGGTKLFRDLAVGLANHDVATIRTEKIAPDDPASYSLESLYLPLIDEALDEAEAIDEVSFGEHYVLGHSLGGHLVGELATLSATEFDGVIALSAPARRMDAVVADQIEYVRGYSGPLSEADRRDIEAAERIPETVRSADDDEILFEFPASFWRILLDHSPVDTVSAFPSLVLCGGRDWRLSDEDLQTWSQAATNNDTMEYELYDQLDHRLMQSESAENPVPGRNAVNLDDAVISRIAEWTCKRTS